jgi:hypothetical protein
MYLNRLDKFMRFLHVTGKHGNTATRRRVVRHGKNPNKSDSVHLPCASSVTMAPTPPFDAEEAVARVQTFVEENKKIVIGAAVVAAVGIGYYAYSSSRGGGEGKGGKKAGKDTRKDKKGGGKSKAGRRLDQPDGPLLEERSSDDGMSSHLCPATC